MYRASSFFTNGHEGLRHKCSKIDFRNRDNSNIRKLVDILGNIMTNEKWDGVSPNNIIINNIDFDYFKRILIVRDFSLFENGIILNPKIRTWSEYITCLEGCGSIRFEGGEYLKVLTRRPKNIRIEGYDLNGEFNSVEVSDTREVSVICHEIDHLDGRIIIDRARSNRILKGDYMGIDLDEEYLPAVLVFDGRNFNIHNMFNSDCTKNSSAFNNSGFPKLGFDVNNYDLVSDRKIKLDDRSYKVKVCSKCF